MSFDPTRIIMIQNQVCRIESAFASPAGSANSSLVAAVTGSVISVMGWRVQSQTSTAGFWKFRDDSAGSFLTPFFVAPTTTSCLTDHVEIGDTILGIETTVSKPLYVNVDSPSAIVILVWYITYNPNL